MTIVVRFSNKRKVFSRLSQSSPLSVWLSGLCTGLHFCLLCPLLPKTLDRKKPKTKYNNFQCFLKCWCTFFELGDDKVDGQSSEMIFIFHWIIFYFTAKYSSRLMKKFDFLKAFACPFVNRNGQAGRHFGRTNMPWAARWPCFQQN